MAEELTAVADPIEQDTTQATEETAEQVTGDIAAPAEGEAAATGEDIAADGRVVPQKYREIFKQDRELKDIFFQNRAFKEAFPGGVTEAKQMLEYISEKGGRDAIESISAQLEESRQIDQALVAGDPRVFDHVEQVAPGSLAKLIPEGFNRWNATDPEGCNTMLCGLVANSLNSSEIPQQMYAMGMALKYAMRDPRLAENPSLADLMENFKAINDSVAGFANQAKAQTRTAAPKDDQISQRERALTERETQQFTQTLNTRVESVIAPKMFQEAENLGYKDISDRQKGLLYQEVVNELNKVLGDDFGNKFKQATSKKDLDGAMRLVSSRAPASLPDIVKRVTRELFGSPVGRTAKPATPPTPKPPERKPASKPVDAFDRIYSS